MGWEVPCQISWAFLAKWVEIRDELFISVGEEGVNFQLPNYQVDMTKATIISRKSIREQHTINGAMLKQTGKRSRKIIKSYILCNAFYNFVYICLFYFMNNIKVTI